MPGLRQVKRLINLSPKNAEQLLELQKRDLRLVTNLFSGHCPLRYHLKKMGLVDSETCRFCDIDIETAEHLLCECIALSCKRLKFLEGVFLVPEDIKNLPPRKLTDFAKSLGIPGLH